MAKTLPIFGWASLSLVLCASAVRAQEPHSSADSSASQPTAPYPPLLSWASSTETPMDSEQLTPDQRPLTGVQGLTLGQYSEPYSLLLPSISVTTQLDTNPSAVGYNGVSSLTYLLGRLDLHHVSRRSELLLNYAGGGMISNYGTNANSVIQDLEFSDSFKWQRWSLLLGDQVNYLSDSPFGFGGVGGLGYVGGLSQSGPGGVLGGDLPSLNTPLAPSQTIPTANVPRLSSTALMQVEYDLSPRSSWTAAGSYGLLRFFGMGYIDNSNVLFQTGYNYQVSPRSSIAVLYRLDAFWFSHLSQGIDDHAVQLAYARRMPGQLSFQLAAGSNFVVFHAPVTGSPTHLSWSLDSSLHYQLGRNALSLGYDRLLTGGSGVLLGAETNQVQGTVGRELSQTWEGSVSVGYARNRNLAQTAATAAQGVYDYWYGTVRASRLLRPGMAFFLAYGVRLQGTNTAACSAPSCKTSFISHEISLGFNWGLRPIELR